MASPSLSRKAEIAAFRVVFDAYFARLNAALEAHERCSADQARDELGKAIDAYLDEVQATTAVLEEVLEGQHGKRP